MLLFIRYQLKLPLLLPCVLQSLLALDQRKTEPSRRSLHAHCVLPLQPRLPFRRRTLKISRLDACLGGIDDVSLEMEKLASLLFHVFMLGNWC